MCDTESYQLHAHSYIPTQVL